jgi:hypothetical protein
VEVLIETANRVLARKGFSPEEARVDMTDPSTHIATLRGALIAREATDLVANLVRVVDWMPTRADLVDLLDIGER